MIRNIALFQPASAVVLPRNEARENAGRRGYDAEWAKLSARYRRRHPLCEECEQQGRSALCDVVDHIIPVADRPDLRLEERNLWALCNSCHNGLKRRMEAYARKAKRLDDLPNWCRNPASRPKVFRPARARDELHI